MKHIKFMILGYMIALLMHGCDNLIGSEGSTNETHNYDRGCCEWNPIYVKVVE